MEKLFTIHLKKDNFDSTIDLLEEDIVKTTGISYSDGNAKAKETIGKLITLVYIISANKCKSEPDRKRIKV